MSKKWISIAPDAKKEEASIKEVVSSNFIDVRMKHIDESAVGSTRVSYQVRGIWKNVLSFKETDFDTLRVPDAGRMQIEGSPEIPQEGLFVAVPENAEVKEVKVISKKEKGLDGEYYILPASKPVVEGVEPEHIPNKEIYESDEPFPGKYVELLGTKHVAGRKVAHILVYLVQYKPKSKRVKALESIDLQVIYETRLGMDAEPRRKLLRKSPLEDLILDSESIAEGERARLEAVANYETNADAGLRSSQNRGEYLIITTNDLKNSVGTLVSAKRANHTVKVVTKEDIVSEFPRTNVDESIQEFLKYAVDHWYDPPDWVVLAGDVDKIPTHITTYETYDPTLPSTLASDHYYADLFGDLTPEIVVSRLPVSNARDMEELCSLASSYGTRSGAWRKKILLTAYENHWDSYGNWRTDYIDCKDEIATMIGTRFSVTEKHAGQSTEQEVKDALNSGVLIANYRGHGGDTEWSASNGLNAADVRGLSNANRIPLVFSIACWNAHIDMTGECFGETWIRNGKAIAFLSATRPSFTYPNHDFDEYLFDGIIRKRLTRVGDIMNWAKTKLLLNYSTANLARDNIRMYLLLGDPTAGVYFVGNRNTKELHISDCRWANLMFKDNRRYFSTIEEAINKGYNGCYYCLRKYDTG